MSKIVAATGASVGSNRNASARAIEQAMAAAVKQCAAEGVTDQDEVRRRMLEARERVKRGQ